MSAGDQTPATKKVKLGECTYIFLLETVLQVTVLCFVSTVIPSSSGVRPQISSILLEEKEKGENNGRFVSIPALAVPLPERIYVTLQTLA